MNKRVPAVWLAFVLALILGISTVPNPAVVASPRQGAAGRGAAPPAQPPQNGRQGDPTKGAPPPAGPRQFTPPSPTEVSWEWWNDPDAKKILGLDERQSKEIDGIYDRRQRLLKPYVDEYMRRREALDKMSRERVVDRETYAVQVTTYEALRSELAKSRSVMLYEIYLKLKPEQYQKLQELRDQRFRNGRGGGPAPR